MPRLSALTCPTEMLTAAERDLIRRELGVRFGSPPGLAEGIFLRVWRSGHLAGQPKVPAAVQSMVDRGPAGGPRRIGPHGPGPLHRGGLGRLAVAGGPAPRPGSSAVRTHPAGIRPRDAGAGGAGARASEVVPLPDETSLAACRGEPARLRPISLGAPAEPRTRPCGRARA
jgi:hypothetical protein